MIHALKFTNLSLLVLYPIAWIAPLAHAGLLPFFRGTELTIFSGISDLWDSDIALAMIVSIFAVVMPYFKPILLALIQFGLVSGPCWMTTLEIAGKLSMTDVFLIAMYVVVVKGVGVGHVDIAWGLYLFTALVLTSLAITIGHKRLEKTTEGAI